MKSVLLFFILLVLSGACIDMLDINLSLPDNFPIAIDGYISDQPGPYEIRLNKAFDVQANTVFKTAISARKVTLSDDHGNSEILTPALQGVYRSRANGIRGTLGRAYKIRVELLDGRIYESLPDTLSRSGTVDSVYYKYHSEVSEDGILKNGFDVLFNSSPETRNNFRFMWKFVGTFRVETNPELYDTICADGRCPKPLLCSGYVLDSLQALFLKSPCECCTCWTSFFNQELVLSDNQFVTGGKFSGIKVGYIPINQWTFMYKVHSEVRQMSLSQQAYTFWKAVNAQRNAAGSLFLPVTGKVRSNFVQISGTPSDVEGLFYATSISRRAIYITRDDVHPQNLIPPNNLAYKNSCLKMYPNSTLKRPAFWTD